MKRMLLLGLAIVPVALFANEGAVETDIVQRTVNFIIFAGILWYLLADKIKAFFAERSLSIQSELDKVQDTLKASQEKVKDAQKKLEEAKKQGNLQEQQQLEAKLNWLNQDVKFLDQSKEMAKKVLHFSNFSAKSLRVV